MKWILDNIIVATLNFLGVAVVLWICKRMSIFTRCMPKHLKVTCHDTYNLLHCLQKENKIKHLCVEGGGVKIKQMWQDVKQLVNIDIGYMEI